jgi:hypothetical protein
MEASPEVNPLENEPSAIALSSSNDEGITTTVAADENDAGVTAINLPEEDAMPENGREESVSNQIPTAEETADSISTDINDSSVNVNAAAQQLNKEIEEKNNEVTKTEVSGDNSNDHTNTIDDTKENTISPTTDATEATKTNPVDDVGDSTNNEGQGQGYADEQEIAVTHSKDHTNTIDNTKENTTSQTIDDTEAIKTDLVDDVADTNSTNNVGQGQEHADEQEIAETQSIDDTIENSQSKRDDETRNDVTNEGQKDSDNSDIKDNTNADADADVDVDVDVDAQKKDDNNNEETIAQSVGAKIIMNRFSTWRKSANDNLKTQAPALQENAKQASEYAQRVFQTTSFPVMPTISLASRFQQKPKPEANNDSTTKIEVEEKETNAPNSDDKNEENNIAIGSSNSNDVQEKDIQSSSNQEESNGPPSNSLLDNDDDEREEEEDDTTGKETADSRARMMNVLSRAESVATSFRGRYTLDVSAAAKAAIPISASGNNNITDSNRDADKDQSNSQMSLILKSRAGEYMQHILDQLESNEFAMLLGRGMLGVNLKQCYLKNHGIFVDYLVDGGQARQSGLIRSGDLLVRLGEADFRRGTIKDVPMEIARAKRPSVLVLATGTNVALERVNFVDVAIAMMHRARKYYEERGSFSILPSARTTINSDDGNIATPSSEKEEKNDDPMSSTTPKSVCSVTIETHDTTDAYASPPWPNLEVRKEFIEEASLRCLDNFVVSDLRDVLDMDSNFRAAIRNAFLVCALDSRRLPFLARYLSTEEQQLTSADFGAAEEGNNNMTPNAELMLFLELASFLDLYDITPTARLRESAARIAYKFFLPTQIGNGLQPPLFDFHHIVPYSSLRHLEFVLNGKSQSIPRDLFLDFQKSVIDSLSGSPFLSFLASADCSTMRAYLRNTAPYVNIPFKPMMDAIATGQVNDKDIAAANNSFTYTLIYLICRMEKECSGEYDFAIESEINRRILGSTHDICCALFIKRTLLPIMESTKVKVATLKVGEAMSESLSRKFITVVEQFWDLYLADCIELSTKNTEMEGLYYKVRNILELISNDVNEKSVFDPCASVDAILKSALVKEATILADELLYDYAANVHNKFRDHKFHEWMCSELCKVLASDPYWYKKEVIPVLPQGCLKRLLRKVELPSGVSSHKPYMVTPKEESDRNYHNADWAVVFGSSVGTELASQMPVPGLDSPDIRRYTCLPVALDRDHTDYDDFRPEEVLPATFESYAFVPPSKLKPFQTLVDAGRVTVDGWEVSLVTFTIPNGDSSSSGDATESALYGVSLCFQRKSVDGEGGKLLCKIIPSNLVEEVDASEVDNANWNSPITFEKTDSTEGSGMHVRNVKISSKLPVFEKHLKEQSWVERVLDEEYRDQSSPVAIGIALVSRKNVIFSMRDTLSRLFFDYSRQPGQSLQDAKASTSCGALVELLGSCSYQDHEGSTLRVLLEPYLRVSTASWVDRPLAAQETAFESHALRQLTDCLPPTSLALLFVTALLEQKIIFSSGRRSMLHAACVGLATLIRPLKWSHLLVPMVPGALANDLIQYPAPFILGVPSEDADSMDLLSNLPRDVTLVDLDVGRVILAPNFGQDNDMCCGTADAQATARALRSQVLYLAQGLGTVFGNSLRSESWICDEPSLSHSTPGKLQLHNGELSTAVRLDQLRSSARGFVNELLEGSVSCCYWIEETAQTYGSNAEPTVLFDEDKFFEIKNHRSNRAWKHLFPQREADTGALALILDDFDLILESFLRCQSMSIYISSRPKTDMFY